MAGFKYFDARAALKQMREADNFSNFSNFSGPELQNQKMLEQELARLKMMYQACLDFHYSPDHHRLSESSLLAEKEAFARLEKRMREIRDLLSRTSR